MPATSAVRPEVTREPRMARAAARGLAIAVVLVGAAFAVPPLTGWNVHASGVLRHTAAPLYAAWDPHLGIGTPFALLLAWAGVGHGHRLAERLEWRRLLGATYAAGLAWALALAFVSGPSGLSRATSSHGEYLFSARRVDGLHAMLQGYVARIPLGSPGGWPTHPAGHPPGALLFFVVLVRTGLGDPFVAGLLITLIGVSMPIAVLVTMRALGQEALARQAAPYLVLTPAALWIAVSADALFGTVGAWGVALVAVAATTQHTRTRWGAAAGGGLLLGLLPTLSYGLVLYATLPIAVLIVTRAWRILPVVAVVALLPVLALAGGGFVWWEAYPVLRDRYWAGIAHDRPASYWLWGDLASLLVCAGPMVGAGLASVVARGREVPSAVRLLVGAAALSVAVADLSLMSKAEVERIWLPFVPWLLLSTAFLPESWRRRALVGQVVTALLVEHLLLTGW
ncbi:MAG TPA: hypothetical protein VHW64_10230 [Nocardioides sp.]|uniref:hypothetical protein n=1 Tax=Nocardioides sp. TaxID=35761 RepID=UPI002E31D04E|nr:hypothetical protein [Nocardioides sp.]HEX3931074.1 hypothetical protein [Nocardioides sp.]